MISSALDENPGRDVEAKRLRSLQIDHELEVGWLNDRQLGRLFAL